ncbi:MAG: hypothetical protein Q9191_004757 [Dirinaria sp. TL-2023a]
MEKSASAAPDCLNPQKNPIPACWDQLNVGDYLQDWWQENQADCDQNYEGDGFASCFQQKVGRGVLLDQHCEKIGAGNCDRPGNFSAYKPQEYYVLMSIHGVWQWFNNAFEASGIADGTASDQVGKIVQTINPAVAPKNGLGIFLQVLTAAFAFIDLPGDVAGAAATTAVTALQQAPGVAHAIYAPDGTLGSQIEQWADLQNQLATVIKSFQANVANGLKAAQTSYEDFSAFVAKGVFIASESSLNTSTAILTEYLSTYVISQALNAYNTQGKDDSAVTGFKVEFTPNTIPYNLRTNGSLPTQYSKVYNCVNPPDQYGLCGAYWTDGTDEYALVQDSGPAFQYSQTGSPPPTPNAITTLVGSGWTTGQSLLEGAKDCAIYQVVTGNDSTPYVDPQTLVPKCISSLPVYMWDQPDCIYSWSQTENCAALFLSPDPGFHATQQPTGRDRFKQPGYQTAETYLEGIGV